MSKLEDKLERLYKFVRNSIIVFLTSYISSSIITLYYTNNRDIADAIGYITGLTSWYLYAYYKLMKK